MTVQYFVSESQWNIIFTFHRHLAINTDRSPFRRPLSKLRFIKHHFILLDFTLGSVPKVSQELCLHALISPLAC